MVKASKERYCRFKKHCKSLRVSLIVAGNKKKPENPIKHMPSRHQKPSLEGPQASKPHKNTTFSWHEATKSDVFLASKRTQKEHRGLQMARSGEKCANLRNISQYWRPKRTKTDSLRPTKAVLSPWKIRFLQMRSGCHRELRNTKKHFGEAFRPQSIAKYVPFAKRKCEARCKKGERPKNCDSA
jgi:hypothetical protein